MDFLRSHLLLIHPDPKFRLLILRRIGNHFFSTLNPENRRIEKENLPFAPELDRTFSAIGESREIHS